MNLDTARQEAAAAVRRSAGMPRRRCRHRRWAATCAGTTPSWRWRWPRLSEAG